MKRKFLFASLAAFSSIGVFAQSTIEYSYADPNLILGFGKSRAETYDAAICIDNPSFAGAKITKIEAYLNENIGLGSTSLWMTKELTLDGKTNVPDLWSEDLELQPATWAGEDVSVLSLTLSDPYVFTGDPVYIGYTVQVPEVSNAAQKYPLLISPGVYNDNGFWLHTSSSVGRWTNYSPDSKGNGVLCMVVYIEGDFPQNGVNVKDINDAVAQLGNDFTIDVELTNIGASTINEIGYSYTLNGENKAGILQLENDILPNPAYSSTVSFPIAGVDQLGAFPITLTIDKINGNNNESNFNSGSTTVYVSEGFPKRRPLVEEYTGFWCGWCPRGYLAMEMIGETFGDDAVVACYHNADALAVTSNYPGNVSGYPYAEIDRTIGCDPYYGTNSQQFGIADDVRSQMAEECLASIELTADVDGDNLTVNSEVRFIKNISDANYYVGFLLIGNGMVDPEWKQVNYYSKGAKFTTDGSTTSSQIINTPLAPLYEWPSGVTGLEWNDVVLDVKAVYGTGNEFPSEIEMNVPIYDSYTFNITNNRLCSKTTELVAVGFLFNGDTYKITNANKVSFGNAAVKSINSDSSVVETVYYDLKGVKVTNPDKGIFIKVDKLANGQTNTSKVAF